MTIKDIMTYNGVDRIVYLLLVGISALSITIGILWKQSLSDGNKLVTQLQREVYNYRHELRIKDSCLADCNLQFKLLYQQQIDFERNINRLKKRK